MLDGSHFYECQCESDEHTLKFVLDKGEFDKEGEDSRELYVSIFLDNSPNIFKRLWIGLKYIFGYKCKYGHWDNWIMKDEDALRLKAMLNEYLESKNTNEKP